MSEKYNGWTNYPTWNVNLWIDNEEYTYRLFCTIAEECLEQYPNDRDKALYTMTQRLESDFKDTAHQLLSKAGATSSTWADLLGWALGCVNWREIAESHITAAEQRLATL